MSEIYYPSEDSYLLSKILKKLKNKLKNKKILEIGSGSGIQLQTLKSLGVKNIVGLDINQDAIKERFNLIIFNPPYLPKDKKEPKESQLATTGGKKGSEIINRFLKQAKKYLKKNGKIIFLTSSLTKDLNWQNYKKKKIAEKKLFFETLYVWELSLE